MESKNQSDEVKCFDEKEGSLVFTNTNNYLFSGDVSLMQEHEYVFPKEECVDHIDFVFGETFDSWEAKELWQPKQFEEDLGHCLQHSFECNCLKGEFHTPLKCLFDCCNFGIGCDDFNMSFDDDIANACGNCAFHKFYVHDNFLFHGNRIWILPCYLQELFVRESHSGGLMDHFGVHMLDKLSKCCYLSHMQKDVRDNFAENVACMDVMYMFKLHDFCTTLNFSNNLWTNFSMHFQFRLHETMDVGGSIIIAGVLRHIFDSTKDRSRRIKGDAYKISLQGEQIVNAYYDVANSSLLNAAKIRGKRE